LQRERGSVNIIARSSGALGFGAPSLPVEEGAELSATAAACGHHGEVLQGVFEARRGFERGLVSLPCASLRSEATARVSRDGEDRVAPGWRKKAVRAARLTLDALGHPDRRVDLTVTSNVPVAHGFGSSTTDVVAAIRAVAAAVGGRLDASAVAELAVSAEVASDATMFDRAVLFAQRKGRVIEDYLGPLPAVEVLGFSSSAGGGVDTLALEPAAYSLWEVEAFRPLRGLLRKAIAVGSARGVARVASASARLNQRHLPVPCLADVEWVGEETGALGFQVSHSGDIAGLLFDPRAPQFEAAVERAAARLATVLDNDTFWRFRTGSAALGEHATT
jgi:uncharacterized protein involved in propanediol utilization